MPCAAGWPESPSGHASTELGQFGPFLIPTGSLSRAQGEDMLIDLHFKKKEGSLRAGCGGTSPIVLVLRRKAERLGIKGSSSATEKV